MRVVFFGTSAFAARILDFLSKIQVEVVAIVTRPDRPQGRFLQLKPSPAKEMSVRCFAGIPVYQPEKASTEAFCEELKALSPDIFLVVAYGEIIKNNLLAVPKKAAINIHASLLPKYRGAAPMQRCLMDGCAVSGITIMDMVLQMDAGDILIQETVSVPLEMNCGQLEESLLQAAFRLLPKLLGSFDELYQAKQAQPINEVTFANKILPEEMQIDWSQDALQIHNLIRALSPVPGAWCKVKIGLEEKRLKILASYPDQDCSSSIAQVMQNDKTLSVGCGQGALKLLQVQLEGKKLMAMEEFLRGLNRPIDFLK